MILYFYSQRYIKRSLSLSIRVAKKKNKQKLQLHKIRVIQNKIFTVSLNSVIKCLQFWRYLYIFFSSKNSNSWLLCRSFKTYPLHGITTVKRTTTDNKITYCNVLFWGVVHYSSLVFELSRDLKFFKLP